MRAMLPEQPRPPPSPIRTTEPEVVVVQRRPDGTRHLAQWRLTDRGRQATTVVRYQPALSAGDAAPGLAVTGDEALVAESVAGGAEAPAALRVLRVRLR